MPRKLEAGWQRAGNYRARGLRFAIVLSRFNSFITERLLRGALDALARCQAERENIEVVRVPGSFEIPLAAKKLAASGRFDAIITLGAILRGETSHFEYISSEVARGVQLAALETGVPITFGVLTCDTLEQAIERAGAKSGNKGFDVALSAVEMANLLRAAPQRQATSAKKKKRKAGKSRRAK